LHSAKIIGTDASSTPVYKYDTVLNTGATGTVNIPNLEWDSYYLTMEAGATVDLAGTNPPVPIVLPPGQNVPVSFSITSDSVHSLLVKVLDMNAAPLAGATVRLSKTGYDQSKPSGDLTDPDAGQAFFGSLQKSDYLLEVTLSGYTSASSTISVANDTIETVVLSPE